MPYAQNDWWWAIDNVRLTSPFPGNPLPGVNDGQWTFATGEDGGGNELPEDIDGDGQVGFSDFLILSGNFGTDVDPGTGGDIDGNGKVEFADFLRLSGKFGVVLGEAAPSAQAAATDLVFALADGDDSEDDGDALSLDI